MQVTLSTGADFDDSISPQKLNDPEYSIKLGAQVLASKMKYFSRANPRFLEYIIKAYNEGQGHVLKVIAGTEEDGSVEYWARFQRNLARVA